MIKTEQFSEYPNFAPGHGMDDGSKSKMQPIGEQTDLKLTDELKPLWVACYFERRLSKIQIQAVDLKHTMRVLHELLSEGETDFRKVFPFVFGFIKILLRKFNFLISESNSTLESLKNPFANEEDEVMEVGAASKRQQKPKQNIQKDGAFGGQNALLKQRKNFIDLTNVKFPGLDQQVFDKIEEALKLDILAQQQKRGILDTNMTFMKKEDECDDSVMQDIEQLRNERGGFLSAIKREFDGEEEF